MDHFKPYKFISTLLFLFIGCFCYGQQTEFRVNAYSGLFFFRGSGATSTSTVIATDIGYFNNTSYGKKSGFSYALELQAQRVTKQKHLFGLGVSYENLESRAVVDSISAGIVGNFPATGKVIMASTFLTVNPYIGQRFAINKIALDALVGMDVSFNTKVHEEAKVEPNQTYTLNYREHPKDFRPRIQLNAYYNQFGFLTSRGGSAVRVPSDVVPEEIAIVAVDDVPVGVGADELGNRPIGPVV